MRSGDLHPAIESHLAKYRKLIPALALLLHLADKGQGPVGEMATMRALAWGEYLESHALRAYGSVAQAEVTAARAILRRLENDNLRNPFSTKDVWRPGWTGLSDREVVLKALALLVDYNHLVVTINNDTGGRAATLYQWTGREASA